MRCRVADRPPCQLVVPTDRTSPPGSDGGSMTTSGTLASAILRSVAGSGRYSTLSAPRVPRAVAILSQRANSLAEPTRLTMTLISVSAAAVTAPRISSSDHRPPSWPISRSTTPMPDLGATWYPCVRRIRPSRSLVSGATSVRPLSTLDTVETDTPADAAMLVRLPARPERDAPAPAFAAPEPPPGDRTARPNRPGCPRQPHPHPSSAPLWLIFFEKILPGLLPLTPV